MTGKELKAIIERKGIRMNAVAEQLGITPQALGHSPRNATTAIYIRRDTRKVDAANRRVIDFVLHGKTD